MPTYPGRTRPSVPSRLSRPTPSCGQFRLPARKLFFRNDPITSSAPPNRATVAGSGMVVVAGEKLYEIEVTAPSVDDPPKNTPGKDVPVNVPLPAFTSKLTVGPIPSNRLKSADGTVMVPVTDPVVPGNEIVVMPATVPLNGPAESSPWKSGPRGRSGLRELWRPPLNNSRMKRGCWRRPHRHSRLHPV